MRVLKTSLVSTVVALALLGVVGAAQGSNFSFSAGTLSCSATAGSPTLGQTTDSSPIITTVATGDYVAHAQVFSNANITMNVHIAPDSFGVTTSGLAQQASQFANASASGGFQEFFSVSDPTPITMTFVSSGPFAPIGFWRLENVTTSTLVETGGWGGNGSSFRTLPAGQYRLIAPFGFLSQQINTPDVAGITISVPEPTTCAAAILAGGATLVRRRRR